jgi:hypothetical protein
VPVAGTITDRLMVGRRAWSARPGLRRLVVAFPAIVALIALVLYAVAPSAYFLLVRDYSLVENLQVVFYLAGAAISFLLARRLRARGDTGLAVVYLVGALGLFVVAGEEISWGQELWERIIPGFPDSEDLRDVNAQGETTLHNLHGIGRITNMAFALLALYGTAGPLLERLLRRGGGVDRTRQALILPRETVPAFALALVFFLAYYALTATQGLAEPHSDAERAFLRFQEIAELGISLGILLHVWLLLTEESVQGRAGHQQ